VPPPRTRKLLPLPTEGRKATRHSAYAERGSARASKSPTLLGTEAKAPGACPPVVCRPESFPADDASPPRPCHRARLASSFPPTAPSFPLQASLLLIQTTHVAVSDLPLPHSMSQNKPHSRRPARYSPMRSVRLVVRQPLLKHTSSVFGDREERGRVFLTSVPHLVLSLPHEAEIDKMVQ
jgi:hypothetical protein